MVPGFPDSVGNGGGRGGARAVQTRHCDAAAPHQLHLQRERRACGPRCSHQEGPQKQRGGRTILASPALLPRAPPPPGLLPQPLLSAEAPQRVAGEGRDPTPSGEGAEAGGRGLGAARTPRAPPTYSCAGALLRRLTNRSHDDRRRRLVESDRLMLTLSFLSISTLSLTHELMSLLLWVITDGRTDLHVPRTRSRAAIASSVFFAFYY